MRSPEAAVLGLAKASGQLPAAELSVKALGNHTMGSAELKQSACAEAADAG